MRLAGITAEYNPFHRGHAFHLLETRRTLGEDCAVAVVMSGDFVQRGEAAVYSKYARAEAACRCGADLVVELPLPWCLASAEGFARAAVFLLARLGCHCLSFGSECGELERLRTLSAEIGREDFQDQVRSCLKNSPSLSYAAAREDVLRRLVGTDAELLRQPNNILAVEYLRSIEELAAPMEALSVRRLSNRHDGYGGAEKSALELREMLARSQPVAAYLPGPSAAVFSAEDRCGRRIDGERLELAVLSRLRTLPEEAFEALPDASDGLGRRLYKAVREASTLREILEETKTKRYALSRIRRLVFCAALGVSAGDADGLPPYARILAANGRGCEILKAAAGAEGVPLISKPASVRDRGGRAERIFTLGARAHDLFVLGYTDPADRRCGEDWRQGPRILNGNPIDRMENRSDV
ncbi:MAG: nucleotidyltransferase family protein [Oscillospiraceae bacterium]|nr:nucleotidyltransferase family protein [Oscillospiraceae bacterium]